MAATTLLMLFAGALCASAGQVLFKLGANGRSHLLEFVNLPISSGFLLYGASAALWIAALSRTPLIVVYPFTLLTFVLVYGASIVFLGERFTPLGLVGALTVLVGLGLIIASQAAA